MNLLALSKFGRCQKEKEKGKEGGREERTEEEMEKRKPKGNGFYYSGNKEKKDKHFAAYLSSVFLVRVWGSKLRHIACGVPVWLRFQESY